MVNDTFLKMNMLYRIIGEINEIESCETNDDVKNHKSKLDAVLSCITDVDKREFSTDISDTIITNIKKALEEIYIREMKEMHEKIGIKADFEPCEYKKPIDFEKRHEKIEEDKREKAAR